MIRIGIDPGVSGAIAMLPDHGHPDVFDIPTMQRGKTGNKQQVNGGELARILRSQIDRTGEVAQCHVYLELVKGMPRAAGGGSKMGATSAFNFGETSGCIRGVIETLAIPYTLVPPERWKKRAGLLHSEKDAARTRALQLFPNMGHVLQRKKDIGRADALLIARFGPDESVRADALTDPFELEGGRQ